MELLKKTFFIACLLLTSLGAKAVTLFVDNLFDDGSAGSLRGTIMAASSGDTIQFNVTGTISFDEARGELIVDKQLTIDGQNKIIVDGQNQINIGFHITNAGTADASNSIIQNIVIQNFNGHNVDPGTGTESVELPAYGILIENGAEDCSVVNTTIRNINSGHEETSAGLRADENMQEISGNIINNISSELNAAGDSGNAYGVFLPGLGSIFVVNCDNNSVTTVSSGDASGSAGSVFGIVLAGLAGNCINNSVSSLSVGAGQSLLPSRGIAVVSTLVGSASGSETNLIACNTIKNITASGSFVDGILVVMSENLTVRSNVIDSIENTSGPAHGILLGVVGAVTNSLVSFNSISNIMGSNNNGYGISIENTGTGLDSVGNDLLNNSIFNINGTAINIAGNGIPVDGRVILSSVRCADGCKLIVTGTLIPAIDAPQYKLQFFVSDSNNPSQTQVFIAERTLDASSDLSFKLRLTGLPPVVTFGKYITATVTAVPAGTEANNNTSEISNALLACEPTGNICQCAEVVEPEVPTCPISIVNA